MLRGLPAANDALIAVLLKSSGVEAAGTLQDYDDLAAILAARTTRRTSPATRADVRAGDRDGDDTNNRVDVDCADISWTVGSSQALGMLVICYDADTTGGTDANLILLVFDDAVATTPAVGTLTYQVARAGSSGRGIDRWRCSVVADSFNRSANAVRSVSTERGRAASDPRISWTTHARHRTCGIGQPGVRRSAGPSVISNTAYAPVTGLMSTFPSRSPTAMEGLSSREQHNYRYSGCVPTAATSCSQRVADPVHTSPTAFVGRTVNSDVFRVGNVHDHCLQLERRPIETTTD